MAIQLAEEERQRLEEEEERRAQEEADRMAEQARLLEDDRLRKAIEEQEKKEKEQKEREELMRYVSYDFTCGVEGSFMTKTQISAKRGPDSRLVGKANTKAL